MVVLRAPLFHHGSIARFKYGCSCFWFLYKPAITVKCKNDRRQPHKKASISYQYCCESHHYDNNKNNTCAAGSFARNTISRGSKIILFPHSNNHERQAPGLIVLLVGVVGARSRSNILRQCVSSKRTVVETVPGFADRCCCHDLDLDEFLRHGFQTNDTFG